MLSYFQRVKCRCAWCGAGLASVPGLEAVSSLQPTGIYQDNTVCMLMLVWVDITHVNRGAPSDLLGQVTRGHAEWPESLSFFFLFSSPSWERRKIGLEERKSWKWLDEDYRECCLLLTGGKSKSKNSVGIPTVITLCSPEEKPAPSLWMSPRQTATLSAPLWSIGQLKVVSGWMGGTSYESHTKIALENCSVQHSGAGTAKINVQSFSSCTCMFVPQTLACDIHSQTRPAQIKSCRRY